MPFRGNRSWLKLISVQWGNSEPQTNLHPGLQPLSTLCWSIHEHRSWSCFCACSEAQSLLSVLSMGFGSMFIGKVVTNAHAFGLYLLGHEHVMMNSTRYNFYFNFREAYISYPDLTLPAPKFPAALNLLYTQTPTYYFLEFYIFRIFFKLYTSVEDDTREKRYSVMLFYITEKNTHFRAMQVEKGNKRFKYKILPT